MEDYMRKEYLSMHNIIKTDDGYELQNNYYEDGERIVPIVPYKNQDDHVCQLCSHFVFTNRNIFGEHCGYCEIYNKLLNMPRLHFVYSSMVVNCAAYDKVEQMNVINSVDEMITFIERTANFFGCPEDYEAYFGFERNWNEETGDILETVREYYNRGGKFENIPTRYPCAIRFDWDCEDDLEWIYIGE